MTELKTLKDLREKGIWLSEENAEVIKQEAIKWVKHIEQDIEDVEHAQDLAYNKPLMKVAVDKLDEVLAGQITWIKHFFNIIEEDLK